MKQAKLFENLQPLVLEQLALMYPDLMDRSDLEAPAIIQLPKGIHPYNRASGYIYTVDGSSVIVLYQVTAMTPRDEVVDVVRHELCHWHQRQVQKAPRQSQNPHRSKSWQVACLEASRNLWPDVAWTPQMFSPFKSVSVKLPNGGRGVRKVQREGALTDVELHNWPDTIPGFLKREGLM